MSPRLIILENCNNAKLYVETIDFYPVWLILKGIPVSLCTDLLPRNGLTLQVPFVALVFIREVKNFLSLHLYSNFFCFCVDSIFFIFRAVSLAEFQPAKINTKKGNAKVFIIFTCLV